MRCGGRGAWQEQRLSQEEAKIEALRRAAEVEQAKAHEAIRLARQEQAPSVGARGVRAQAAAQEVLRRAEAEKAAAEEAKRQAEAKQGALPPVFGAKAMAIQALLGHAKDKDKAHIEEAVWRFWVRWRQETRLMQAHEALAAAVMQAAPRYARSSGRDKEVEVDLPEGLKARS